jgi:hypothetical protein
MKMNKLFLFVVTLIVSLGSNCFAQVLSATGNPQDAVKIDAPVASEEILTLPELEFNFGKIPQGKPVTHIFEVKNNGKDSLKISNVQASCGCTTPEWERNKEILSGEKSIIKVGYNAAAEGSFNKSITIMYNDNQNKLITIKGEVWKTPSASAPSNEGINELKNK